MSNFSDFIVPPRKNLDLPPVEEYRKRKVALISGLSCPNQQAALLS
jgi:hypothetical protein